MIQYPVTGLVITMVAWISVSLTFSAINPFGSAGWDVDGTDITHWFELDCTQSIFTDTLLPIGNVDFLNQAYNDIVTLGSGSQPTGNQNPPLDPPESKEDLLCLAKTIADQYGMDPAVLMAILSVESREGAVTGVVEYTSANMSSNSRRQFEDITDRLGRNNPRPLVSHGGAMGPCQFLPKTWEGIRNDPGRYHGVVTSTTDPWKVEDCMPVMAEMLSRDCKYGSASLEHSVGCYNQGTDWENSDDPSVVTNAKNYYNEVMRRVQNYNYDWDKVCSNSTSCNDKENRKKKKLES